MTIPQTGINKKEIPIIPFVPGAAHLQMDIVSYRCYICKKEEHEDMVLIKIRNNQLGFACLDHPGVAAEFIKQYKRPPLGWIGVSKNGRQDKCSDEKGKDTSL
jgi:hypothetical protein